MLKTSVVRICKRHSSLGAHGLNKSGFTLVEVLVSIAIIVLVMGISFASLRFGADPLKEDALAIKNLIRRVYSDSIITKKYYRIVFDLDEKKYWVESKNSPFLITLATDEEEKERQKAIEERREALKSKLDEALAETAIDEANDEANEEEESDNAPQYEAVDLEEDEEDEFEQETDSNYTEKFLFEANQIEDVWVTNAAKKIAEGQIYLHVFPNGWIEAAIINLSSGQEENKDYYSIEVRSTLAKVEIRAYYYEDETAQK